MADVKLNSLATKTNSNAAAILVKDSATQNQGAEGWITKAQLNQIIRDEVKAQMSAITSGTPDVPVLDGSTMKYMTLLNFAKAVEGLPPITGEETDMDNYTTPGVYSIDNTTGQVAHCPYQGNMRLNVECFTGTYSFLQTIYTYVNDVSVYIRRRSSSAWGGWEKVVIGEYPYKFASTGDANTITEVGAWHISPSNYDGWTNIPSDSTGILWVPFYNSNYWKMQFYITHSAIYYRIGSPFTWKKITIQ